MDIMGSITANSANVFATLGKIAQWTFYGLILLGVIWIFIYFMRFKYPIYLYIQEGMGIRIKKDRGWKDKKKRKFTALKNKDIDFPYPETKHEFTEGRTAVLCGYVKNQSVSWMKVTENYNFIPADYDMQHKMINDIDSTWNIVKPKQGFWDKWGQQILWLGSLGIFLVVIILILKRMDAIIALGRSVATAQATAGKQVLEGIGVVSLFKRDNDEKG